MQKNSSNYTAAKFALSVIKTGFYAGTQYQRRITSVSYGVHSIDRNYKGCLFHFGGFAYNVMSGWMSDTLKDDSCTPSSLHRQINIGTPALDERCTLADGSQKVTRFPEFRL